MMLLIAHQLGHSVNAAAAVAATGGSSGMRPRPPSWSERWCVVASMAILMLGWCSG